MEIKAGKFWEFGVGNGTENNTLTLAAMNWSGCWIGNEPLIIDLQNVNQIIFMNTWVTLENIQEIVSNSLMITGKPNLVSIDLDGVDYHIARALLEFGIRPELFIVEYNASIPVFLEYVTPYESSFEWDGSNFFGASLLSLTKLFEKFDYYLVCCNAATGVNAFFIPSSQLIRISEFNLDISDVFATPFFFLPSRYGHKKSPQQIQSLLERANSQNRK